MSKKTIFIILLLLFLSNTPSSFAQIIDSCDLCGWCKVDNTPTKGKPADWEKCMQCLFPSKGIPNNYAGTKPAQDQNKPNYPSTPETEKNWTVLGCLETKQGGFVTQIYKVIVSVGSGLALLAFIYGGFLVLTAGGDPLRVASGKHVIMGAISGLILIIFAIFILRFIGFEIIKIPGFG